MWPCVWQMACRLEEIPEPGDFVEYEICDQSILVVRQADRSIKAFHNACRHRATQLCKGTGRLRAGQIVCPFHGWRWNLDGSNSFVYGEQGFAPECLQPDDIALQECKVDTWGACAWINMDPEARPLREALSPGAELLDNIGADDMPRVVVEGDRRQRQLTSDAAETSPPIFGGGENAGAIRRPLFLLQHTHDTSGWPEGGVHYADLVQRHFGNGTEDIFRFWWIENAEHISASTIAPGEPPVASTRLTDYTGSHDAALDAMVAFVERGVTPQASTTFVFDPVDKGLHLPATAAERYGIQPIATVTANGGARAHVRVGDRVVFAADAAVPSGAGAIVEIAWDFDGRGTWPEVHVRDTGEATLQHETTHVFEEPGTYFAAARVVAHPTGDSADPHSRVENLGRCRVVVRA